MFIALLYFSRGRALLVAGGGDGVGRDQRAWQCLHCGDCSEDLVVSSEAAAVDDDSDVEAESAQWCVFKIVFTIRNMIV